MFKIHTTPIKPKIVILHTKFTSKPTFSSSTTFHPSLRIHLHCERLNLMLVMFINIKDYIYRRGARSKLLHNPCQISYHKRENGWLPTNAMGVKTYIPMVCTYYSYYWILTTNTSTCTYEHTWHVNIISVKLRGKLLAIKIYSS